ncbi:hypothetical protein PTQ27_02875 [Mannheimia sp. AT1]|uniref:Uncharacterized protein n=1 Tax=Mannheimia cairinae TaxID=3025936 RepID=A0ABT5MMJ9_9PAST|nr:hypothetical protein [Mannheimia cairinae]MDD0823414.1 hypothetical protein [Mannheimia cairinae]MDD0826978.1 hypothetical protein [Mannheimia cairinae]
MQRLEQTYTATNGVKVIYKHKPRKYDFNHLIVVFSGFLNAKPGNYDFNNALNDCPADVIWINDNFEDMYTYYLCVDMNFKVEEAIKEFIDIQIKALSLDYEKVTVTGFSKGGSAALYYGLKLPVANIVTTVPQIKIGSYVVKNWPQVASHMMGELSQAKQDYLDKLIIQLLRTDIRREKNIYLLTSEADIQYESEIKPILDDLRKYSNFNLIKSYSVFCREHNQITSHHTSTLLGLYYLLTSGGVPHFPNNEIHFFGSQPLPIENKTGEPIVDTYLLDIKNGRLFIDGVALLKGYHLVDYNDVAYELIFKGSKEIVKPLAKAHKPYLTKEFFDGKYLVIYDKGWFTTYQYKGIDISDVPTGDYQLFIHIMIKGLSKRVPLVTNRELVKNVNGIKVYCKGNQICLKI